MLTRYWCIPYTRSYANIAYIYFLNMFTSYELLTILDILMILIVLSIITLIIDKSCKHTNIWEAEIVNHCIYIPVFVILVNVCSLAAYRGTNSCVSIECTLVHLWGKNTQDSTCFLVGTYNFLLNTVLYNAYISYINIIIYRNAFVSDKVITLYYIILKVS